VLKAGVIDQDSLLIGALRSVWQHEFDVVELDAVAQEVPDDVDVAVVDLDSLGGHALRFLHDLRHQRPGLILVVTYVYWGASQRLEEDLDRLADLCVVKPFDITKLGKSIRHLHGTLGCNDRT